MQINMANANKWIQKVFNISSGKYANNRFNLNQNGKFQYKIW